MSKSRLRWCVVLLLLSLLLSSCGPITVDTDEQIPAAGQAGQLVLAGGSQDPPTLDPALASDSSSTFVIRQIYSGLVTLDADLQVVPDLASQWSISDDGLVYTFALRPEARFHDGREVTADDFIYAFERACNPVTGAHLPCGTYLNDIAGVPEMLAGQADHIAGLQALDDHTLEVTLAAPSSYFLSKLTYNTAYVVDRFNVEQGGDWTEQPNGTGPFRLEQWQHNQRIVLARNEDYYREPAQLEEVILLLGASASQPLVLYEQDQIDYTEVGTSSVARLEYEGSPLAGELEVVPELSFYYVGFNTRVPPLDDPNVRRAITMVLDRARLARVSFEGRLEQAQGILPPGMPGYNPDLEGLPYDPEQARQLLAQSRYGGPEGIPRLTLYTTGGMVPVLLQEVCRQELGVEIELRQVEWSDFLVGLDEQRYPMFVLSWIADYPDPQNFLEILFHSASPSNHTAYSNPEVDQLLEQAAAEQDTDRRMELYRQAERLIVADAPVIPITHGVTYALTKPYVRGLEVTPMGLIDLAGISIEE